MYKLWIVIFLLCISSAVKAQDMALFKAQEDSLVVISDSIVYGHAQEIRDHACYSFIKTLIRTLDNDNSFNYRFDSLTHIRITYAPDNTFRFFTWQAIYDDGSTKYFGAIQKNTKNLTLFGLYDKALSIQHPQDTISDNNTWYGAIYYKIIQKKNRYFLLGWRNKNNESNIKLLDVLRFNKKGKPVFGEKVIETGTKKKFYYVTRLLIEYKSDAITTLNFDTDINMIVYDHTIAQNDAVGNDHRYYVPDGSYDALRYKGGRWRLVEDVFKGVNKELPNPVPFDFNKVNQKARPKK